MFSKMSPWVISWPWPIRFWFVREDIHSSMWDFQVMSIFGVLTEGRRAPTQQMKMSVVRMS